MITVKQFGIFLGLLTTVVLLIVVGGQSRKIKNLITKLLKADHNLETQKLDIKREQLKKKVKVLNETRRDKKRNLTTYLKLLNKYKKFKSKSKQKSNKRGSSK